MRAKRQPRADEASVGDSALSSLLRAASDAQPAAARGQQDEIGRLSDESGRYHAAIEALPQGVCVFDGQARLAVCNHRYADLYRLDPERLKPGVAWREIVDLRVAAGTLPLEVDDYLVLARADARRRAVARMARQIVRTAGRSRSGGRRFPAAAGFRLTKTSPNCATSAPGSTSAFRCRP